MKRILIIEDDQLLLKMYKIKLSSEGFEVDTALDGIEGLKKLSEKIPDMILLDLMMPNMDGFEFLEIIRKNPAFKEIPVVIFTNLGQERDLQRAKKIGVADYLIKADLTPQQVVDKIWECFEKKNRQKIE